MNEYKLTIWYGNHHQKEKNDCDYIHIQTKIAHTPYLILNSYLSRYPNGFVEFILEAQDHTKKWFIFDETGMG